jgi:hypothetical protein
MSAEMRTAFSLRDVLKWLGHSGIAGALMFVGLWLIVPGFDVWQSLRFGVVTAGVAFFGGLLFFGGVYVLAYARSRAKSGR